MNCIFYVVLCFYCVFCVAMGLATIEVMQAMQRTWSNSKVRVNGKTRQLQWRDMFDIAVKWRRSDWACLSSSHGSVEGVTRAWWLIFACVCVRVCVCVCVCVCVFPGVSRIADPDQPVLWLDQMPARSLSRGFNNHINLIRCCLCPQPVICSVKRPVLIA